MHERSDEQFPTTLWTYIRALKSPSVEQRRQVLDELVGSYWPPVYAFLRRQGCNRDQATELTQAFFSDVVLGRELFAKADQARGRLRTLLLCALRRYRIDQARRAKASGALLIQPTVFDAEDAKLQSISCEDSDAVFEKRWALALFEETLRRCEAHFRRAGKCNHWLLFDQRVLTPARTGNAEPSYASIPAAKAFDTRERAAAAVQVVKRRFTGLFREVVAETVERPDDVDSELASVRQLLENA
jgi:DNA-directed RNA polymerase specialized sigma24 family protein